jgi:RND family efflux transporter MFP subunit
MLGLGLLGWYALPALWENAGQQASKPEAVAAATTTPASDATPRVDVIHPTRGGVRRVTTQPGSIHAFESVELCAKVSGFLKTQSVDIGSRIRQGEPLAAIDAPELQRDVEEAEAAVAQARALAELALSRVATADAEREAADALVAEAETDQPRLAAKRLLAEKQCERIKGLHERDAIERRLVDEHQEDMEAARAAEATGLATIKTARAAAAAAAAKVRQAKADVRAADSTVRVAAARLARAEVLAGYTRLTAPFDGVITRRVFHPGAFIRSAADGTPVPLLTAMRTDKMRVVIQVPDLDVPLVDVGDPATVVVDALKGREFKGSVARLGKSEDPTTRTMRVEVDLPNPDGLLVDGMYVRATINLQPPSDHLTVPAACVVGHSEHGTGSVFVVRAGKTRRLTVTIGNDDGTSVEILAGVEPNDKVVIRPGATLNDGTAVVVANVRPAATTGL